MWTLVKVSASLCLILVLSSPSLGWHKEGHMAVARTAWYQLNNKQKAKIASILKAHPHYKIYLIADRTDGVNELEWAFVRGATWPDWVRDPRVKDLTSEQQSDIKKQFSRPTWHFVNLPYVHPKDMGKFDAAALRDKALIPEFDAAGQPRHALAALKQSLSRLQATETSDETKAISLCWLLHLVGDLHQPLHAATLIASKDTFDPPFLPPHGDEGGNRLAIKVKQDDESAMTLHFFWDGLVFMNEPPFPRVDEIVTGWLREAKYKRDQLSELKESEFLTWAEESLGLSKTVAYKGEDGFLKARSLSIVQHVDLRGFAAPALPTSYQRRAENVASRRMVVAGYRLADQLDLKQAKIPRA